MPEFETHLHAGLPIITMFHRSHPMSIGIQGHFCDSRTNNYSITFLSQVIHPCDVQLQAQWQGNQEIRSIPQI